MTYIDQYHRVGKKDDTPSRATIIKFTSHDIRSRYMKNIRKLEGTPIGMK